MKKPYIILLLLLAPGMFICAQTIQQAKDLLKTNKTLEAKKKIDSVLQKDQHQKTAEAWYVKAKVYSAIATDPSLSKQFPGIRMEAFNALKKYTEIDDGMLIHLQIDGYKPINEIYTGFYTDGANGFNAADYDKAFTHFVNAINVAQFMNEKKWINMPLDTNSVLYAGVSAEKLQRFDDAVLYYSKLIEGRVKGQGFVEIYKWVANYYFEKKNNAEAQRIMDIGKSVYPSDPFWTSLELDMARESGNPDKLFAKYEEAITANPTNHLFHYNYAVELYQRGYNTDPAKRPDNSATLISRARENIRKAATLKPDYARAQLFAGQLEYNEGVDKLKTNKAEALKKFDAAIPYFLKVEQLLASQPKLSVPDKSDLQEAFDLLITIYDQKGDKEKVKSYEVKFNEVSKK